LSANTILMTCGSS